MQINFIPRHVNFRSAKLNIVALSDTHGNVSTLPNLTGNISENKKDIFPDSAKKSTLNIMAVVGDWFINPSKKGFLSHPKMSNGDIQTEFFAQMVNNVRQIANGNNFDTIYTMGNHCLDGGDKFILDAVAKLPINTIVSNVDMDNSPAFLESMNTNPKLVTTKIYDILDDKDPNITNKVLFLGVTIPSMKFYNPELLKGTSFINDTHKKDVDIEKTDLSETFEILNRQVRRFKKSYPKGTVIVMSHTGQKISKFIAEEVSDINVILNAHDHKNNTLLHGNTLITSLGKDNEIVKSLSFNYDDNGDLEDIDTCMFQTDFKKKISKESLLKKFTDKMFAKDVKPIISFSDSKGEIESLPYSDELRYSNSSLANYITSSIKRTLKSRLPDIDIVGIQSSNIRGGIKNKTTNLDIMKVFDGVSENLSSLNYGKLSGKEIVDLIIENIKGNLEAPTRNTIIQWSDLQVNKTMIQSILSGKENRPFSDAVKIRNKTPFNFIPIDLNKNYEVVLGDKILMKKGLPVIESINRKFSPIGITYDEVFREHLDNIDYDVRVNDKVREQRIL